MKFSDFVSPNIFSQFWVTQCKFELIIVGGPDGDGSLEGDGEEWAILRKWCRSTPQVSIGPDKLTIPPLALPVNALVPRHGPRFELVVHSGRRYHEGRIRLGDGLHFQRGDPNLVRPIDRCVQDETRYLEIMASIL